MSSTVLIASVHGVNVSSPNRAGMVAWEGARFCDANYLQKIQLKNYLSAGSFISVKTVLQPNADLNCYYLDK